MMRLLDTLKSLLRGPGGQNALDKDLKAVGTRFGQWIQDEGAAPRLYCAIGPKAARELGERFPDLRDGTVAAAQAFLEHRFSLLGSGEFVPLDPGRTERGGYAPIDWNLDPVRGLRFPSDIPPKGYDPATMRPGNADIKYPWELARCQHFAPLAQAWLLSGDARYAREILLQIADFTEACPVGMGPNWVCTMDVAIRAANWAIGLELVKGCPDLDERALHEAYASLFDHGAFIADNFEDHYEVTSNHYLSNVVGLHFLAAVFGGLPRAGEWDAYCRKHLEREIDVQILPDGADFESSVPYHRLVLELFLASARLAAHAGRPLSAHYNRRLGDMAAYLLGVLRPDGQLPTSGDADDGRLHILTQTPDWQPQDGLHILGPAALHQGVNPEVPLRGRDVWECGWWGFDTTPLAPAPAELPASEALFPDAGHAVCRTGEGAYLLVNNARVGTEGFGNHKHNDQLSFELHLAGTPLVVDPGSYVYTSDPDARNLFRSTASHNTVSVGGQEQNEFNPEWLFRMFEKAEARHLHFGAIDGMAVYCGMHRGFERFAPAVTHTRALGLLREAGVLLIADALDGLVAPAATWHFHLAPGVGAAPADGEVHLDAGDNAFSLAHAPSLSATAGPAWYSPSYGVRRRCVAVDLAMDAALPAVGQFAFAIGPRGVSLADYDVQLKTLWHLLQDKKRSM